MSPRFDDIIRTERFFSATLLPAVLLHAEMDGLRKFLTLVDGQTTSEHAGDRRSRPKVTPLAPVDNTAEVITEFHIARDLESADLIAPSPPPVQGAPKVHRDAPDLVIVVGNALVVIEAKFFAPYSLLSLNRQLRSQRRQVTLLFDARPGLVGYRHIALLPSPLSDVDADGVLTWEQIRELAVDVMGNDHYVTGRLTAGLRLYRDAHHGNPAARNWDGRESIDRVIERCAQRGDAIEVGLQGGLKALKKMSHSTVRQRRWKWRDPESNEGVTLKANWIAGSQFHAEARAHIRA